MVVPQQILGIGLAIVIVSAGAAGAVAHPPARAEMVKGLLWVLSLTPFGATKSCPGFEAPPPEPIPPSIAPYVVEVRSRTTVDADCTPHFHREYVLMEGAPRDEASREAPPHDVHSANETNTTANDSARS